ncbi:hypothetical protein EX30DRAFT_344225 [Ascodesmis nigricans]|uniref:Uncharacterized protein n=1 Tax=Ascodesmis nigricans TaxID=341454 RepID=A0A4S2MR66_9PEZI|nr:hypothetical protein EX30DRAFT_344225 [Ascodesmis nigricans]
MKRKPYFPSPTLFRFRFSFLLGSEIGRWRVGVEGRDGDALSRAHTSHTDNGTFELIITFPSSPATTPPSITVLESSKVTTQHLPPAPATHTITLHSQLILTATTDSPSHNPPNLKPRGYDTLQIAIAVIGMRHGRAVACCMFQVSSVAMMARAAGCNSPVIS